MGLIKKLMTKINQKKVRRVSRGILGIYSMVLTSLFLALVWYAQAFAADPDVFAQEAGNEFNYQGWESGYGSYNLKETVSHDTSTFPTTTYKFVLMKDSYDDGNNWFERETGVLKLRGLRLWDDEEYEWLTFKFSTGLPWAWYPVKQIGYNESNSTTMTVNQTPGFNVSVDVTVLAKESVALGFDTLEAYKIGSSHKCMRKFIIKS